MKLSHEILPTSSLRIIRRSNALKSASFFAGLTLLPELLSNNLRLEALIHYFLLYGKGSKRIKKVSAKRLFEELNDTPISFMEDPAEDVMVSLVKHSSGCYKLLEGLNEKNAFYTQRFIDVLEDMPDTEELSQLKQSVLSFLQLSDLIIEKASLQRYQEGNEFPKKQLEYELIKDIDKISGFVSFTTVELSEHLNDVNDLAPFIFNISDVDGLADCTLGHSPLEKRPIVVDSEHYYLLIPSAVGLAIRWLVIKTCDELGKLDVLVRAIQDSYLWYFHTFRNIFNTFSDLKFVPFRNSAGNVCGAELITSPPDSGRFTHFLLVFDDFDEYEDKFINGSSPNSSLQSETIYKRIETAYAFCSGQSDFREGKTIAIFCGWGRMTFIDFGEEYENWQSEFISASDLEVMSQYQSMNFEEFWSFLDLIKLSESTGLRLQNPNGLLNLLGWVEENKKHIIPHESLPSELDKEGLNNFILNIGTNHLLKIRKDVYQRIDRHCSLEVNGELLNYERYEPYSVFEEDEFRPIYHLDKPIEGLLTSKIEGSFSIWHCQMIAFETEGRELSFRIWDALTKWIYVVDNFCIQMPLKNKFKKVVWNLRQGEVTHHSSNLIDTSVNSLRKLLNTDSKPFEKSKTLLIATYINDEFIKGFNQEKNFAEKALVLELFDHFMNHLGVRTDSETERFLEFVFQGDDARYVHSFKGVDFLDYVADKLPKAILINQYDDTGFRVGLGFRVKQSSKSHTLIGISECTNFLEKLVDSVVEELTESLSVLDKRLLIEKLLKNNEAINQEYKRWTRTVKANLALHSNKTETSEIIGRHLAELNASSIATRVATEVALCESQKRQSIKPDNQDIVRLLTKCTWLFHLGNLSDAIKYGTTEAKLVISAGGEILFNQDFNEQVVDTFGMSYQEKHLEDERQKYNKHINEPAITAAKAEELINKEFLSCWSQEFGFSIDEARELIDALEDFAINKEIPIISFQESDFYHIGEEVGISKSSIQNFIISLSSVERDGWTKPPKGFKVSDILPWRFRRRLSLISRPIIQYENKDLVIAPGMLRASFGYLLRCCYEGEFDKEFFRTKEMRSWVGSVSDKRGHEFNKEVEKAFIENGWHAQSDMKLSHLLNAKMNDFGDIDVVAWDEKSCTVLLIECKSLIFAKTPGEIAKQLSEFQGVSSDSGKPDRLLKHLNRIEIINKDLELLQKQLKLKSKPAVYGCLLFSEIVPMLYLDSGRIRGVVVLTKHDIPVIYEKLSE
jgi:hypothetical protein